MSNDYSKNPVLIYRKVVIFMEKFKIFVSTCKDVKTLNKAQMDCFALDLPNKWSDLYEVEAESLEDAFNFFYETEIFKSFINNNYGKIYNYYLEKGEPILFK